MTAPGKHEGLFCPSCQELMRVVDMSGIQVDECRFCDGIWLDEGEPEALVLLDLVRQHLLEPIGFDDSKSILREGMRLCPRCFQEMEVAPCNSVSVDVCGGCRGLFLDRWELQRIVGGNWGAPPT